MCGENFLSYSRKFIMRPSPGSLEIAFWTCKNHENWVIFLIRIKLIYLFNNLYVNDQQINGYYQYPILITHTSAFSLAKYWTIAAEKLNAPYFVGLTTTVWETLLDGGILSIFTLNCPPAVINESVGKLSSIITTSWAAAFPTLYKVYYNICEQIHDYNVATVSWR